MNDLTHVHTLALSKGGLCACVCVCACACVKCAWKPGHIAITVYNGISPPHANTKHPSKAAATAVMKARGSSETKRSTQAQHINRRGGGGKEQRYIAAQQTPHPSKGGATVEKGRRGREE